MLGGCCFSLLLWLVFGGVCGLLLGFCYLCAGVAGLVVVCGGYCCLCSVWVCLGGVWFWGLVCDGCFGRVCVLVW